jgi:hypothetical protein
LRSLHTKRALSKSRIRLDINRGESNCSAETAPSAETVIRRVAGFECQADTGCGGSIRREMTLNRPCRR